MEKLALALVTAARKLRPYFQSHSIVVMTSQPLRTILHSPSQSGRLAKWAIKLSEHDIEYKPRTCAKAQVLADFLIELAPDQASIASEPVKWTLHVDGSSSKQGAGVGIRLVSSAGETIEQSYRLGFSASNNEAEYEALIAGLRLALSLGIRSVSTFCDSQLVASQFHGEYEAKDERMEAYLKIVQDLTNQFEKFELTRIPRGENASADALAALASTSDPLVKRIIPVEGIAKPSISIPVKAAADPANEPPLKKIKATAGASEDLTMVTMTYWFPKKRYEVCSFLGFQFTETQDLEVTVCSEVLNVESQNESDAEIEGHNLDAGISAPDSDEHLVNPNGESLEPETTEPDKDLEPEVPSMSFKDKVLQRPDWMTPIMQYIEGGGGGAL